MFFQDLEDLKEAASNRTDIDVFEDLYYRSIRDGGCGGKLPGPSRKARRMKRKRPGREGLQTNRPFKSSTPGPANRSDRQIKMPLNNSFVATRDSDLCERHPVGFRNGSDLLDFLRSDGYQNPCPVLSEEGSSARPVPGS